MKKISIFITSLISLISASSFAACIPPTARDYTALMGATGFNQPVFAQKLLNTYCYDLNTFDFKRMDAEHPIYYAPTQQFLNFYVKESRDVTAYQNKEYNLDVLSKLLVLPHTAYSVSTPEQKEKTIALLKNYEPTANVTWFNSDYETIDNPKERYTKPDVLANHRAMLNYLAPFFAKLYSFPKDKNDNDVLYYSMITNEYNVFRQLSNENTNFYRRNKDGFTLFHLAFGKHVYAGTPQESEDNLKRINDIVVRNFRPNYVNFLNIKDVPYYNFVEIMKDNNPDLYTKLKARYGLGVAPTALDKDAQNKPYYDQAMNYIKDLN